MNYQEFLSPWKTPYESIPFSQIKAEEFVPMIEEAIKETKIKIESIVESKEIPSFHNTIELMEDYQHHLGIISSVYSNLNHAHATKEIQATSQQINSMLTSYSDEISTNMGLFERIKAVLNRKKDGLELLNEEQEILLDKYYKDFTKNGALLSKEDQGILATYNQRLSELGVLFEQNILKSTTERFLHLKNKEDLEGLTESFIQSAEFEAKQRSLDGYVITLQMPSYMSFMKLAKSRDLRQKLHLLYASRSYSKIKAGEDQSVGETNNPLNMDIIKEIASLKLKKCRLLGYQSYAHYVLEDKMAQSPETVNDFLKDILKEAKPFALSDIAQLSDLAKKLDNIDDFSAWDISYYSEKLKNQLFNFDDEALRPYLPLDQVLEGVFQTSFKLYGLTFKLNQDIDVYHPEVKVYEVLRHGSYLGLLYTDFFPRPEKSSGAWMTSYKEQFANVRPHISIVCNFTKPTDDRPSLLTFMEVTTLFHEFGHALHGLCSQTSYRGTSGTSVFQDFVELPSQIFENWTYEKECLDLFAKHYQTNGPLPFDMIQKIRASANFLEGHATLRQLTFGMIDMAWHTDKVEMIGDLTEFEKQAIESTLLFPYNDETNISCAFSHIFRGMYGAGYYGYKWAEVLDATAFECFQKEGIFNPETSERFFKTILSKGGSVHPMKLFKEFNHGQGPNVKALLKRAGFLK